MANVTHFSQTTNLNNHTIRQWEIAEWAQQQQRARRGGRPFSWVALDDDTSLTEDTRFATLCAPRTVQTESAVGLTEAGTNAAIDILLNAVLITQNGVVVEPSVEQVYPKAQKRQKR